MEVRPVLTTRNKVAAGAACDVLRAHGIKCDIVETGFQNIAYGLPSVGRVQFAVVVAAADEQRAASVLKS
jgi:hypothetical protein